MDTTSGSRFTTNTESEGSMHDTEKKTRRRPTRKPPRKTTADTQAVIATDLASELWGPNWGGVLEDLGLDVVASFLDIDRDGAEALCMQRLLRPRPGTYGVDVRVPGTELLRFLKRHGRSWFEARLKHRIRTFEAQLAAAQRKAVRS